MVSIATESRKPTTLLSSQSDKNDWSGQAAKLREEIKELEQEKSQNEGTWSFLQNDDVASVRYDALENSVWSLKYRFSDQPEDQDEEGKQSPRRSFGGELLVRLRADGYTDLLSHEPGGNVEGALDMKKAWGWDVEQGQENNDSIEYLLFSVDAQVPGATSKTTTRFYFQARQEVTKDEGIVFSQGTVTVKQDIVQQKSSRPWGFLLMSPAGILAQFRYVGDFVAKPGVLPS